ncbi:hypothetical protein BGW39_010252 [Mortierella sp. 14UC]|nr:hypothetical protein BGW39_010252 [Mortierella sp. 14UC]
MELLYDSFVRRWLEVDRKRLEDSSLSQAERLELDLLVDDDFFYHSIQFQKNFAMAIFTEHKGNPVVKYTHLHDRDTWKGAFFAPEGQVKLLRESSTVMRSGFFFQFLHRSLLEYFYSRTIYDPCDYDSADDDSSDRGCTFDFKTCLGRMTIIKEPSILQFLAERVLQDFTFKQRLLDAIEESKADEVAEAIKTAAANAISILVKARTPFHGADLRGIRIPGADLSDGQFDSVQFQGADLRGVSLARSWLRRVDMSGAQLKDARFGELPQLDVTSTVTACSYSSDRKLFAAASETYGFLIYDTSTWAIAHYFTNVERLRDIAFSPDNQHVVSGGQPGVVQMWDLISGKKVLAIRGHTDDIRSVAFSPCGKQIASAGYDTTVRLWNSLTGKSLFVLEGHTGPILSVKYSSDGRQIASGSMDETIRFWDPATGEPGVVLGPSLGKIRSLAYSPDGHWIASNNGVEVQLWNVVTREPGSVLRGHTRTLTGIAFSPNSQWIASSSNDQTVRLWDALTGTLISTLVGHSNLVSCVTFSPDGLQIASGDLDGMVRLWEVDSGWSSHGLRDGERVGELTYTVDGRNIQAYKSRLLLQQWNSETGELSLIPNEFPETKDISAMARSRDGKQLAVGYTDGSIRLQNCQTGALGPALKEHSHQIERLIYSQCCRWIASVDGDNIVRLWDRQDAVQQSILVELDWDSRWMIRGLTFSSAGDQLALGTWNGTIRFFNTHSRKRLTFDMKIEEILRTIVYSPNDQQLAIGTASNCIYLWDMQAEKPCAKLEGHEGGVLSIAYSPCGQWLASGGFNNAVNIWHQKLPGVAMSWSRVYSICAFFDFVFSVSWNPVVPMELVTGCWDGSVLVWRLSSDDGENVTVKMLWGSNIGTLHVGELTFTNAVGLSPIYQKLLDQRGALSPSN